MSKSLITQFYKQHLPEAEIKDGILTAECPFCAVESGKKKGGFIVYLNQASFFFGYFRCLSHCFESGYANWFAFRSGIPNDMLPPVDDDLLWQNLNFPSKNINAEVDRYSEKCDDAETTTLSVLSGGKVAVQQLKIGYNGRYIVYPYRQIDGNVYSARCVHPEKNDDYFWYGDAEFGGGETGLFNIEEIQKCACGALFLCEGEENLTVVKQLGFPGVAYWDNRLLDSLDSQLFASIKTLFILPVNNQDSYNAARVFATRTGYKVRILKWDSSYAQDYSASRLASESGGEFGKKLGKMLAQSRPFSPFPSPEREHASFFISLDDMAGESYADLTSGFELLDERLGGIHGINILGGGPKVGKSCFMIQIATSMAQKGVPVLYYDFENGRQRIYQRTFTRLSRIPGEKLVSKDLNGDEKQQHDKVKKTFSSLLNCFRVVNDRKLSPEVMRRHIDFIRHETQNDYTVVVIDSLHKLPFKDLSEMRTGIDSWLRQFESIRDEMRVSFLVISELSRGDGGRYTGEPHMGLFKGSGDIEYSADNAMVLLPEWDHMHSDITERSNALWLVGSREHSPGLVGKYILEYPYWGFREEKREDGRG